MVIWVDPSGPTTRKDLRMESKGDLWMDKSASASIRRGFSAASVRLENQGRLEHSSSHDGALPSRLSSSFERYSSTNLIDGAAEAIAILEDGEVRAMLQDAEVRAVLRKMTINEGVWNMEIQSLGGGKKALEILMGYIMVWVKQQKDIQSSSQQPPSPPPSNPAWNFSIAQNVVLQPSSDAFQILSGILHPPPTTQLLDQEMRYTQRSKSRKLMTEEPEMGDGLGGFDTGFCPSSFISSPEDRKPEVTSLDMMVQHCPQQQQPVTSFTSARNSMPSAKPTPAMVTKAARRHRMTRQRQSFHARSASAVAIAPVSVGGGSLWNTNAPVVASSGMSWAQIPSPRARITPIWEGRNMECLTSVLQKELRPSDVGPLGRIVLPKKQAELGLPPLETRGGVSIQMEDFDSGQAWNFRYRFWPNNRSRMYVLENTAAFVTSHGLVEGDLLVIYSSVLQGGYVVRGMKKEKGRLDREPVQVDFADSSARGSHEENMGPLFESDSSCIQTLDWFPSLTLDFPF